MIYQGGLSESLAKIQVVPVLVVDSFIPEIYDTIIPDLSISWEDYTRFDLESGEQPNYDFDFTDEKQIVLGSGNKFLVYDLIKMEKIIIVQEHLVHKFLMFMA